MRLIKEYLPRAYDDGDDIEARSRMLAAASMGATAFQKGLGRRARDRASGRLVLRHAPRPHQRGDHCRT